MKDLSWIKRNWFKIIAILILTLALGNHPYGFYQLTRWITFLVSAYSAYMAYESKKVAWAWIFCVVAILFNPIAPFYLEKGTWHLLDIAAALILVGSLKEKRK